MTPVHSATGRLAWDADGVLLDSRTIAWAAAADIAALFGPRPPIGSAREKAEAFGPAAQIRMAGDDGASTLRAMHRIVMRDRAHMVGVFEETIGVVRRLASRPQLITAAYAAGVRRALGDRADLFGGISGCENGPKGRLIAEAAATGLAWYVCDTIVDIRRCRGSGVNVIAVTWGYDDRTELRAAAPDMLVETPQDLADALDGLGFLARRQLPGGLPR